MTETQNNLVGYIPPEIWAIIFDKIEASISSSLDEGYCCDDLYNCSRVCVTFRNILELTKVTWLFEKVTPFVYPYLNGQDILNCRATCKTWKHATDHFLETEERTGIGLHSCALKKRLRCTFSTSNRISGYLDHLQGHSGNPFPGQVLSIGYEEQPFYRIYYDLFWNVDVDRLLNIFGKYVHVLHLRMHFLYTQQKLKPCLEHTPNLRTLCLEGSTIDPDHDDNRVLPVFMETLPSLPYLESLRFESPGCCRHRICTKIPAVLQCSIGTQYADQLTQLQINLADGHSKSTGLYTLQNLTHLEDLHIILESAQQLRSIFPPSGNHSKCLRRVMIKIVQFNNRYDTFELIDSANSIRLGDFLRPLVLFGESLQELAVITERERLDVKLVLKKDLYMLKEFKCLRHASFEGFWFGRTFILDRLPVTLECFHVSGIRRDAKKYPNIKYVSMDLPKVESIVSGEIFRRLPRLKELRVRDYDSRLVDVYHRGHKYYWQAVVRHDSSQRDVENGDKEVVRKYTFFCTCMIFLYVAIFLIICLVPLLKAFL